MISKNETLCETKQPLVEKTEKTRRPYSKPQLEELGDIRTFTLGITGGGGDWSNGNTNEAQYP
jgi:hypothetical protein